MPESCARLIDRLIEERINKGMTQCELAKAVKLSQAAIGRLESKKHVPQLDTLLKIASALGCELEIVSHRPNAETKAAIEEGFRLASDSNTKHYKDVKTLIDVIGVDADD